MLNRGTLFIVSAPSGAGKTSLVNALIQALPHVIMSVSYTTRTKRSNEEDGLDYYFISKPQFDSMRAEGLFLEHAEVFGNFYGTSKQTVAEALNQGLDVILEIDWQGAKQVRSMLKDTPSIFILPPNRETLLERLNKRLQDNPAVIEQRMREAKKELTHYTEYDYLVWNDNFDEALDDLKAIIKSFRLQAEPQKMRYHEQFKKLLS